MSYSKLLIHRCNVHHLKERVINGGRDFGIPSDDRETEFYYDDAPDLTDVKCYFVEKNQMVMQGEPNNVVIQSYGVHYLKSTDVRINSKVVWDGVSFKSQKPKNIRNHHQEVTVSRSENL
ncbi:DUF3599 family protein [Sporosarcina sp. resist]|uniref:DUF3599 family protein n=1 Tax=Sporosarcina sp. resist TaxID=2762563 RepID=UPI00164E92C9|nr:DUF3599 family protein [Sporosarcina sp. resist]QNK87751.1 DUF3599 family protein [Sporosarcina sp. resist]